MRPVLRGVLLCIYSLLYRYAMVDISQDHRLIRTHLQQVEDDGMDAELFLRSADRLAECIIAFNLFLLVAENSIMVYDFGLGAVILVVYRS